MSVNNIYRSDEFFRQVAEQKLWTAWRTEKRLNKTTGELKETKVPYCGLGIKSESDDPASWISIEDAKIAGTEGFINGGGGGIGIFLGIEYGTGYRLGGVDLDTCLSPDNGLTPWAKEVVDHFDTYGEISPSSTGVKLYFLYRAADLDAIRLITGTHWSKNFKERTGSDHALLCNDRRSL
jgi:putative DNA primase/helicase